MALTDPPTTQPYKAIAALVLTFAGALLAMLQGRDLDTMKWTDWLVVVLSSLVTAAAVYEVPNPPVGKLRELDPDTGPEVG